jgi:mitogen-activated protein kinase kinase
MASKDVKHLTLNLDQLSLPEPSAGGSETPKETQTPRTIDNDKARSQDREITVEFKLDLMPDSAEDLVILKHLSEKRSAKVSMVQHAATKVIMTRKVSDSFESGIIHAHTTLLRLDLSR